MTNSRTTTFAICTTMKITAGTASTRGTRKVVTMRSSAADAARSSMVNSADTLVPVDGALVDGILVDGTASPRYARRTSRRRLVARSFRGAPRAR